MSSGKVLLGVLAGVAVGAALGILFAPDKGSETRRKIVARSDEYADELGVRFNEFIEGITEKFESMREEVAHRVESVEQTAQELETELTGAAKYKS